MQCLQVQLIGGLGGDELHGWSLHRLDDRLGIAEVILLPLGIGTNILRWHQPGIMAKTIELAAEMMRADISLHANQAPWHVQSVLPSGHVTTSAAARWHHAH